MYHSQVSEYKYEIDRLNRELQEFKSKYYQSKNKKTAELDINIDLLAGRNEAKTIKPQELGMKYLGGGIVSLIPGCNAKSLQPPANPL